MMAATIAPALHALLDRLIDYAGGFPPANLSCNVAAAKYCRYLQSEHAWMLRWFVTRAADFEQAPKDLDGMISVLSDADEPRAAAIEAKQVIAASRPAYCEVPLQLLDDVKRACCFAKIRTGGVTPEAIPSIEQLAAFILACADRQLAFKATAGLHHPVRACHRSLTRLMPRAR